MNNLYNYIPSNCPFFLQVGEHSLEIVGIHEIKMNLSSGSVFYSVWVSTDKINHIVGDMPGGMKDCIILTPTDVDVTGAVLFGSYDLAASVPCHIEKVSYHSDRHGYIVDFSCQLSGDVVKTFKYLGPLKESKEETTRFDLMDVE